MFELVTNPDRFFSELKNREVRIRKPMVIVIALAIMVSGYQYILINKFSQALPGEVRSFFVIGAYISIAGTFLGMFAAWFIMAAIMHGISSFFNGIRKF